MRNWGVALPELRCHAELAEHDALGPRAYRSPRARVGGSRLIVGSNGGVWSSPDPGATWQNHNTGLSTAMFYGGALHPTNRDVVVGGLRDFQVTTRNGDNRWIITGNPARASGARRKWRCRAAVPTPTGWGWLYGDIHRTTNGGVGVTRADAGIDKIGAAFVSPVRKCPTNDDVFLTGTNRLWRTNNFFSGATRGGSRIRGAPISDSDAWHAPGTVLAIAYAPSDASCNTYAYANRGGEIYLTQNGGGTWVEPRSGPTRRHVRSTESRSIHRTRQTFTGVIELRQRHAGKAGTYLQDHQRARLAAHMGRYQSSRGRAFNVIAIDPRNPNLVYAGSDTGLWQSMDGGARG